MERAADMRDSKRVTPVADALDALSRSSGNYFEIGYVLIVRRTSPLVVAGDAASFT
jgi:hypothetical protein